MVEVFRFDYGDKAYYAHKECLEEAERYDPSQDPYFLVTVDADVLCSFCCNRLGDKPGDILDA